MTHQFPKSARVRKQSVYKRINRNGKRFVGRWIVVDVLRTDSATRLGLTVTRRFGKAHERVRFKRIAREAFRLCRQDLPEGMDLNIRPRSMGRRAKSTDLEKELLHLLA